MFLEDLPHDSPTHESEPDWPAVPQRDLLAFLEDSCNVYLLPVITDIPQHDFWKWWRTSSQWYLPALVATLLSGPIDWFGPEIPNLILFQYEQIFSSLNLPLSKNATEAVKMEAK